MKKISGAMNRNYGIDALRLYAMFLVTVAHVLGQGGVLEAAEGSQYSISLLLEIIACCSVNCYGLISGYVGFTEKESGCRASKYAVLWTQVCCYSFGITLCAYLVKPAVIGTSALIASLFPVTFSYYWYFNAYTALFFLIPWMNAFVHSLTKEQLNILVITLVGIFSIYGTVVSKWGDPLRISQGYSFLWLSVLYILGAWLKKHRILEHLSVDASLVGCAVCIAATWFATKYLLQSELSLLAHNSPAMLIIALLHLAIFSKLQIGKTAMKCIRYLLPAAFGVYLIHVQRIVWDNLIFGHFAWIADSSPWLVGIEVIACAGLIFTVCLLIERLRLTIFERLRIHTMLKSMVQRVAAILEKTLEAVLMK